MEQSLPGRLGAVVEDFATTPVDMRLELLLEYSRRVAPLPPELAADHDRLERVEECQTPFFLNVEIRPDRTVDLHFDAPPEAPTVRGFAGILGEGLNGVDATELLRVPPDLSARLGLGDLVSPLRLRGMTAIIMRMKRAAAETAGR